MDDETEDKILYQTYLSHMKLMSKIAVGLPTGINMPFGYFWRAMRSYALKPEVLVFVLVLFVMLFYLQVVDVWSRALLGKIHYITSSKVSSFPFLVNKPNGDGKVNWELQEEYAAAYAIQGHRASMEDRFVINRDINHTGVSLFAVFDGHGGQFAANYAHDKLIPNINKRVVDLKNIISGKPSPEDSKDAKEEHSNDVEPKPEDNANLDKRKKQFRKTASTSMTDDCLKERVGITDPELLNKLDSLPRPITRELRPCVSRNKPEATIEMKSYIEDNEINYAKLLKDEVLAVDRLLVEAAKKNLDVAGSTALIAILEKNQLIVANVGDSRGVMCDEKGNAIPLSFDHKPQQQREKTRINKAGGVVSFNGVWRVAGILATSRALGDYPLKDKKWVIADPDVLIFDLKAHNPMFLVLASDGLWDTFSNEEAVAFIKERIDEPFFGAKSITLQSLYRGSLDNITVLVIDLRDRNHKKKS